MRFHEFSSTKAITPESNQQIYFVVRDAQAQKIIARRFKGKIASCGDTLVTHARYWSLIQTLAYTSGSEARLVPEPKQCKIKAITLATLREHLSFESQDVEREFVMRLNGQIPNADWLDLYAEIAALEKLPDNAVGVDEDQDALALTPQLDKAIDKVNDTGVGVVAHQAIDNTIQQRFATQKPLKTLALPNST